MVLLTCSYKEYFWLLGILLMMAGFIGVKSYTGEPIACFPPSEFTTIPLRKYVDNRCWVSRLLVKDNHNLF